MHMSHSLHSLDCNLADGEYMPIPEQEVVQEKVQEPAPEPATEDLPATFLLDYKIMSAEGNSLRGPGPG
jgi:hypothetical protein